MTLVIGKTAYNETIKEHNNVLLPQNVSQGIPKHNALWLKVISWNSSLPNQFIGQVMLSKEFISDAPCGTRYFPIYDASMSIIHGATLVLKSSVSTTHY